MLLLEREAGLAALAAARRQANQGDGRLVLVSGEAGIGKTVLIEQFVQQQAAGARLLWGACDALFTPRPLGPLFDMAPHLSARLVALLAATAERSALYAAVLAELQSSPAIVVIEDLHWADEATLDLLRFLGRRIARTAALLVVTYRDDELGPRHPLRLLLGDLAAAPATVRLPLLPLSRPAVHQLASARAIDGTRLYEQTGGNPFFVTEVLAEASNTLPTTIRDAVFARVARLSPAAQALAQAAAVIGPRIEAWLLTLVVGSAAAAVEECLAIGIMRAVGDTLSFRHELARQAILEAMVPPLRVSLHRRVLAALEQSAAALTDPARLAHHAAAADDQAALLTYAPAAARHAAAAQAHREAASLYALTLRVADRLPAIDRAQLLEAYARECDLTDQRPQAIAALRAAIAIWHALDEPRREGEKYAQLVPMLRALGRDTEAEQSCQAALAVLAPLPPGPELALALRMQAILHLARREITAAIAQGQQAIALAERSGDADVAFMTHVIVGAARLYQDTAAGCTYLEERLAVAMAANHERAIGNTYTYLGACAAELHQFRRAERYLADGIAYATVRDLDVFRLHMLAWQALTALYLGQWSAAAVASGRVLDRAGVSSINRLPALVALGRLRTRQGEPATALLDEARALAQPGGNVQHLGLVHCARAESAWLSQDRPRLLDEIGAVAELMQQTRHPWFAGELTFWLWRAGETVSAPDWLAEPFVLQIAGDWSAAAAAWAALDCPYEQARALADGDEAAQVAALAIFERLGAWPAAAAVRHQLHTHGRHQRLRGPRATTRANQFGLTARELEILRLLASGLSNSAIATQLSIAPKTVEHHVGSVLTKLDVPSRQVAVQVARRQHLIV